MIQGGQLGRQSLVIGSDPEADLRVPGPQGPACSALLVQSSSGELSFVASAGSTWTVDGRPVVPGEPEAFDGSRAFRAQGYELSPLRPEIVLMRLRPGARPPSPGELILGRDPAECHLVVFHPTVSQTHARITIPPFVEAAITATDLGSTGGTWIGADRLPPDKPRECWPQDVLLLGSVRIPLALLVELHDAGSYSAPEVLRPTIGPLGSQVPSEARRATRRHHTVVGTAVLQVHRPRLIGRSPKCDIVLDFPAVSAEHATLHLIGDALLCEDLGSELGTRVRGSLLKRGQRVPVQDGEIVQLGPVSAEVRFRDNQVSLVVEDTEEFQGRLVFDIEADQVSFSVPDAQHPGHEKLLLREVRFKALPGDLIALMGPSGSGKTTLLLLLTGALSPTSGSIRVNGQPLSQVLDALRGSIGYVPQDDLVHPELTVRQAVAYSARMRLPRDFSDAEIALRVDRTLEQLGLLEVAHLTIGRPEAKVLSGGQRKRVNIALELVTDPVLLFLDEPTSGLSSDDTALLVQVLEDLARKQGKTVIATIHQPAKDEYERFNLALLLGPGGVPVYFGPTRAAYEFLTEWRPERERLKVDNPRDMFAEFRERRLRQIDAGRADAALAMSLQFQREYEASALGTEMRSGDRALGAKPGAIGRSRSRRSHWFQLSLLLSRGLHVKLGDRVGSAILLLQAPLIGLIIGIVFGQQKQGAPAFCLAALEHLGGLHNPLTGPLPSGRDHSIALFFLVVSAVWFGTSNAAREIVAERAIFRREQMVNLSTPLYVLSKFLLLVALCVLQCTMLLGIAWPLLGLPGGPEAFAAGWSALLLTASSSVALGLMLSAVVPTVEAAMALTPLALIPQVVLGGLMVPVTTVPWLRAPMSVMPARWGFEALTRAMSRPSGSNGSWELVVGPQELNRAPEFIEGGVFRCSQAQLESSDIPGAWGFGPANAWPRPEPTLLAITTLLLALVLVVLVRQTRLSRPRR